MYCGIKHKGRMQHTSFLSGGPITSAGTLKVTDGVVTSFKPMSGHYRTTADSFEHFLEQLKARGADLSRVQITKTKMTLWLWVFFYFCCVLRCFSLANSCWVKCSKS